MSEKTTHRAVCDYLRYAYPKVIFNSDLSGSMKLSIGQAVALKNLRSGRGFPDLIIMEPRNGYSGLFIELKKEGEQILTKSGKPCTDHLKEQFTMIDEKRLSGSVCNRL
jgi:hypothetical protein